MPTTPHPGGIAIDCPAKLNLTLAVGAPRADGLHPIASVMIALEFSDTLNLGPCSKADSAFKRMWAADAPKTHPIDWPIENDLAYRALALIEVEARRRLPVDAVLIKRIPAGAGLGGGSSDAAGMLVGLRELFDLPLSDGRLLGLAQQLGADVVFAVHAMLGRRAALVTGIGQVVEPLHRLPAFNAVLVFPDGACPTGQVYSAFDQAFHSHPVHDLTVLAERWRHAESVPEPHNDLTEAAARVCPEIASAAESLAVMGHAARLTGSGSALFVFADNPQQADKIAEQASAAGLIATASRYTPTPSATP